METTLLFLAVCLMFSGVHSESQSMSCSTVNGKTICNKQTSEGNSAMASSQAAFGGGSSYQSTYAGAGSPSKWDSSSQTVNGGRHYSGVSSYVPSGSPNFFGGPQAGGFAIAGGGPYTGVSSYAGSPNFFGGFQAGGGAFATGFAAAGNVPFNYPAVEYPVQDYYSRNGGAFSDDKSSRPMPAAANPFDFVNKFMGNFFGRR